MAKRVYFNVHGLVQGVCFRDFTQKNANSLGLTGWVRNTREGTVEGEVQGDNEGVSKLLDAIGKGPRAAHVDRLDQNEIGTKHAETRFLVVR